MNHGPGTRGTSPHWVSEVDGEIVGWACMIIPARDESLADDVAEIAACYVRPRSGGGGHGHRLMNEALDARFGSTASPSFSGFWKTRAHSTSTPTRIRT